MQSSDSFRLKPAYTHSLLRKLGSDSSQLTASFACESCWLRLVSCMVGEFALQILLRKEVIQPHLPIRLPCYDFTPIINPTFDCGLLAVSSQASGVIDSHGVTGGVYKARERIHRDILIRDY